MANRKGRTTLYKEDDEQEEQKSSGILPYVVGALGGVALGLLGSLVLDKVVENMGANQETAGCHRQSKNNSCAVCLEDTSAVIRTRCCGNLIHLECLEKAPSGTLRKCPFCRSTNWQEKI